jgi:hypothetical protein
MGIHKKVFRDFNKAKKFVKSLKLNTQDEWQNFCTYGNKPDDIPYSPKMVYPTKWVSWSDWLGSEKSYRTRKYEFLPYEEALKIVRSMNFDNIKKFKQACKTKSKLKNVPTTPAGFYKDSGWISWSEWFGINIAKDKKFFSFNKARSIVRKLKINSQLEWKDACVNRRVPQGVPSHPAEFYADQGWKSWPNFLGYKPLRVRK